MIKCVRHIIVEIVLTIALLFLASEYLSIKAKYDDLIKKPPEIQIVPNETVFVEINKPIVKFKKEFVTKVDTLYKSDTLYALGSGIAWKAGIKREFLDIFELIDTIKFSHLDEQAGIFGVEGLLYQKQPLPLLIDIKLKDDGVWYSWGTLKSWDGRLQISARYYDERSSLRFYCGGGVFVGEGLYVGVGALYREKYLTNLFITNRGSLGIGLQIKFK